MRYTERHGGVAVIKDKSKHKEAMEKLAKLEDLEEKNTDIDQITTEMMEHVCDNICMHPIRVGQTQDELDDICAECKMGKFVCDILNTHNRLKNNKPKQYVLVSQGIEIYRTTDKEEAERMMNESNAKHYEYLQRCADEGERPAYNMVYMHVEE